MQYRVYKKDTNEVVVYIYTETYEQVVHKDYDIKVGEDLKAVEVNEDV